MIQSKFRKSMRLSQRQISALLIAGSLMAPAVADAAPKAEATITRTQFGVPHVKAKDFRAVGFGIAYAEAEDNICLMADTYLSVSAQRSHHLGAQGTTLVGLVPVNNVDSDIYYATMLDTNALRAELRQRSKDYRNLVAGWVAGYNRFIAENRDRLPAECAGQSWVRPITSDDVVRSLNSFSMLSGTATAAAKITSAAPPSGDQADRAAAPMGAIAATEIPEGARFGSNGWAFGGDATSNGRGLVVGNPHFPWVGPNRFYQMHLTIPGKLDVAGAAIVNQPFVGIGFNKDVAWTHTVDTAAHMTLFKLTLDPSDPTVYLVDGKRVPMERREIRVAVKDALPVVRTIYLTRYGPIFAMPDTPYAWTRDTAFAVRDANRDNIRGGDGWLAMARARNVRELRAALASHLHVPFLNTMAADRNGEALYADISAAANISADRFADCGTVSAPTPGFLQRLYVLDGSRSACGWETAAGTAVPGLLPASDMSTIYRRDFVQNSNDSYRWTNPAADIPELGPMMGVDPRPLPDMRTRSGIKEIRSFLASRKFDIDTAAAAMLGNRNFAGELALAPMLDLCKRPAAPKRACAALAKWDGKAEIDSRSAMLFSLFWGKAAKRADLWSRPFERSDIVGTPASLATAGDKGDALLADLAAAADTLDKMGVALDAPLGKVQFAERGKERIPISGGMTGGVLNYTAALPTDGGFAVVHGASYVQSVTFDDDGPIAKAILTYSQSVDPNSPHYADQTREFSRKKLYRFPFDDREIEEQAIGSPKTIRE